MYRNHITSERGITFHLYHNTSPYHVYIKRVTSTSHHISWHIAPVCSYTGLIILKAYRIRIIPHHVHIMQITPISGCITLISQYIYIPLYTHITRIAPIRCHHFRIISHNITHITPTVPVSPQVTLISYYIYIRLYCAYNTHPIHITIHHRISRHITLMSNYGISRPYHTI